VVGVGGDIAEGVDGLDDVAFGVVGRGRAVAERVGHADQAVVGIVGGGDGFASGVLDALDVAVGVVGGGRDRVAERVGDRVEAAITVVVEDRRLAARIRRT